MRYLIYLILFVLLAVAVAALSQLYLNEVVIIRYGQWSAEPKLSLLLAALLFITIGLLLCGRLLMWLLFLPATIARWNKQRRSEKKSQLRENVICQLAYGDRRKALKSLQELMSMDTAAAWWAAQVAAELGNAREQKKCLQHLAGGKDAVLSAAANAKLCMQDNRLMEASNLLKTAGAPRGSVLLAQLYYEANTVRGDYHAALAAATYLREEQPAVYGHYVTETIFQQLKQFKEATTAIAFWKEEVASADKKQISLQTKYLECLWRLGDEKTAGEGLSQLFKQHAQDYTVLQAVVDFGTSQQHEAAFKANEQRVEKAGAQDTKLLEIMKSLADKLQLLGKARLYGQMLSALEAQRRPSQ